MTALNHLENQILQLLPLMPTFSAAWQWVYHLLHVSISAIMYQETSNSGNSNIWDRVCGSQDCHRTDHGYQIHTEVPWCTH